MKRSRAAFRAQSHRFQAQHTHRLGHKSVHTFGNLFLFPTSRAAVQWLFLRRGRGIPAIHDGGGVAVDEEESCDEMRADDDEEDDDGGDAATVGDVLGAGLG